jgi:high-affinity iron transporter
MFGTAVIVFREVLEAAIIISIIALATRGTKGRNFWLVTGLIAGLIGSAIVAASTEVIASFASGVGQELFNAGVLGIVVLMLAWQNIWMSSHGVELAMNAKKVGANIRDGSSKSSILLIVVGLAVLREGSEVVLFLNGILASEGTANNEMLFGGLSGLLAGAAVGYMFYAGLLRIPMRWLFSIISAFVLLLAASMASTAASYLIQADILPSLASPLWDTTSILPINSLLGTLLHSLIGYEAHPAGMQLVFYVAVILVIGAGMSIASKSPQLSKTGAV